jgi:hypothetical protein
MPEMTPIDRLLGLPGDLVTGLQQLPVMAASLSHMTAILDKVAGDTRALPALRRDMRAVGDATAILAPMDGRMANIEATMPILVEVQRHLADLPETISALDDRIARLSDVLERMLETMTHLDTSVVDLQGAVEPVGRLASRLPGQKNAR